MAVFAIGSAIASSGAMTRKRSRFSRLEGLKMPFVVTMTLGAAGGCGGTVTERGSESDRTGGVSGGGDGGGGGNGSGGVGGFIERGGTSPVGSGGQYELGGAYPTGGGGNPPYLPPDTVCPLSPPGGGVCNYQGPTCGYYECYGRPTTTATCLNGLWSVSMSSCNPPPPPPEPCPVVLPQAGSYCNYVGDACGYHQFPDRGCGYLDTLAVCNAHAWGVAVSFCGAADAGTGFVDSGASAYPRP
jgi:hypothetical protein